MKMMARPLAFEPEQHLLELGDALWRQHRRGFVEDEHTGTLPERLDDLDLLLLAQRQRTDADVRVERDPEGGRKVRQPGSRGLLRRGRGPDWSPA